MTLAVEGCLWALIGQAAQCSLAVADLLRPPPTFLKGLLPIWRLTLWPSEEEWRNTGVLRATVSRAVRVSVFIIVFGHCIQRTELLYCQQPVEGTDLETRNSPRKTSGELCFSALKEGPRPSTSGWKTKGINSTIVIGLRFKGAGDICIKP